MAFMYAIPLVAAATAALILGERMHLLQFLGAVIIFGGIYIVRQDKTLQGRRNEPAESKQAPDIS